MAVARTDSLMVWGGEGPCGDDACPSERTGAVLDAHTGRWTPFDAGPAVVGMSDGRMAASCGKVFAAGGQGQGPSRANRVVTGGWDGRGWRTLRLTGPVYDLVADERSVYVVSVDARQRAVVHVLDGCTGEELRQLPQHDDLSVTGLWLEVVGGRLVLARSDSRSVRVEELTGEDQWSTLADLSADDMPMPRSATSLHGQSGVAGRYVFGVSDLGLWRFDVRTHDVRAIEAPADACGVGASVVVSPTELLVWGGQRCDGDATLQTSAGLTVPVA